MSSPLGELVSFHSWQGMFLIGDLFEFQSGSFGNVGHHVHTLMRAHSFFLHWLL